MLTTLLLGVGLSAACGFRVFVPPLLMSGAAVFGPFELPARLEWMDSPVALTAFAVATLLEVAAYYLPWVDNLLDVIAAPLAVAAGVLITSAFAGDLDPLWRWSLALIAGGGAAGGVQALTGTARLISSTTTGGLGNPLVSTLEALGAGLLTLLSMAFPLLAVGVVVGLLVLLLGRRAGPEVSLEREL